jgi:hypothetical protein
VIDQHETTGRIPIPPIDQTAVEFELAAGLLDERAATIDVVNYTLELHLTHS